MPLIDLGDSFHQLEAYGQTDPQLMQHRLYMVQWTVTKAYKWDRQTNFVCYIIIIAEHIRVEDQQEIILSPNPLDWRQKIPGLMNIY